MPVPKLRFKDEYGQEYSAWKINKLSTVCSGFSSGQTPTSTNASYYNGNIPWLNSGELNRGIITNTQKKITVTGQKAANLKLLPKGTFLMAITGLEADQVCGNCGILGIESTVNQSCMYLFPKKELKTHFLFQWYMNYGKQLAKKYCQGTKQQSYNAEIVKRLEIGIPSLPEQEKIVDFLSIYDRMIDVQTRRVEAMKLRKKGLLQKIFSQELRFKDERGQEYPEWSTCKIEDLCYMKGRIGWQGLKAKDFIEEGPYCVTGTDFIDGKVNWKTCYHVSQLRYEMDSNIQLRDGDLLITKDGTIGKLAYIEKLPGEACLNSHLLVIRPSVNKLTNKFLYQVFLSNLFVEYYLRAGSGSTMKSLSQSVIGKFMCPLPSIPEQEKIADFLSAVDTQIEVEEKRLETMKTIKKGLLQQMFI